MPARREGTMRLDLDAKVLTEDGEDVGRVQWAIVDPSSASLLHLVVALNDLTNKTMQLPLDLIERISDDGDELHVGINQAEFLTLPEHLPSSYLPEPPGWHPIEPLEVPRNTYLWPSSDDAITATTTTRPTSAAQSVTPTQQVAAPTTNAEARPAASVIRVVPVQAHTAETLDSSAGTESGPTSVALGKGDAVYDRDGKDIGAVSELQLDETGHRVEGIRIRTGNELVTLFGGGERITVAPTEIAAVAESAIGLTVTQAELADRHR